MAFYRRNGNRVIVYYWDTNEGKQKALKRDATRHLDSMTDQQINSWIDSYFDRPTKLIDQKQAIAELGNIKLLIDDYLQFLKNIQKRAPGTVQEHESLLNRFILAYYLLENPQYTNPRDWPKKSISMHDYLKTKGLKSGRIHRCNCVLRRFWSWLADYDHVSSHKKL